MRGGGGSRDQRRLHSAQHAVGFRGEERSIASRSTREGAIASDGLDSSTPAVCVCIFSHFIHVYRPSSVSGLTGEEECAPTQPCYGEWSRGLAGRACRRVVLSRLPTGTTSAEKPLPPAPLDMPRANVDLSHRRPHCRRDPAPRKSPNSAALPIVVLPMWRTLSIPGICAETTARRHRGRRFVSAFLRERRAGRPSDRRTRRVGCVGWIGSDVKLRDLGE